ncbi:unnamed protein product [Brachionus calyciflorus]|uniref:MULE transposase domain-containing protein n=1 Tax=Brachionus calyciflorus TaxID=104777 RepID=A0A813PRY8_9BILA|nr:unnamed protein product [Brachionus calyciflorus]
MFTFGVDLDVGSDDDHFHLGMTSYNLLKNIELAGPNKGIFHLDCTYKIIKFNYLLIVFGLTDIERKIFTICFMFSSHEQQKDFDFFFTSLIDLCQKFDINFSPEFLIIDACKAMALSIKKNLIGCASFICE